LPQVPNFIKIG